ncbi:unnamed protein product [Durusdinium trenchii]
MPEISIDSTILPVEAPRRRLAGKQPAKAIKVSVTSAKNVSKVDAKGDGVIHSDRSQRWCKEVQCAKSKRPLETTTLTRRQQVRETKEQVIETRTVVLKRVRRK